MYPGIGGGKSPSGGLETLPVVGRFPKPPKKVSKRRVVKKKGTTTSPSLTGGFRSAGVPGPGAAGGWRTA